MSQEQRRARGEIRGLTGLRAVAALWVVAHHFWLFAPAEPWLRHLEPVGPLLRNGWLGVDLFFVLSGFVLAHNHVAVLGDRPGIRATAGFYWARLSRIWPTWMVVLTAVTAGLLVERQVLGEQPGSPLDAPTVLRQVLLVQVWDRPDHSATGPVGPGWSLSAEWLAYLAFPVLALVLHRLRRFRPTTLAVLALAAVTPFAYRCLTLGTHDWAWSWLLRLAGGFLAGALVALCVDRLRGRATVARAAARATSAASVLTLVAVWEADASGADRGGVAVLLFPVLVGGLALSDRGPARWLSRPVVVLGGRISFALYLVHMGVFETCWTLLDVVPVSGPSPVATLLSLAVAGLPLPAAWVLWRLVEEPARRRLLLLDPTRRADRLGTTGPRGGERFGADAPVPVRG
ncbi:peptidoglycan/LPS O-acetylase OafA/YrhL [Geodermatophilus normandii]|uniref:Peptidoglycan/LPS O-acetylase OafA/YrhL n=1 Tax=Geodermatophilus normandii TaxID=1137989 RepID=A0A317QJH5_9ACTN|nr:acyltransferase [Geodermatophilus normandii]PWW22911.1 peptidoglycan/LPS O-acetylase OafA/YrhL [Geodermatophilus normandii]